MIPTKELHPVFNSVYLTKDAETDEVYYSVLVVDKEQLPIRKRFIILFLPIMKGYNDYSRTPKMYKYDNPISQSSFTQKFRTPTPIEVSPERFFEQWENFIEKRPALKLLKLN